MASSSHYHYHQDDDDANFETPFEEFFENATLIPESKMRKSVFLLREIEKKATINSGMIILVKLQHILTIYFDDGSE